MKIADYYNHYWNKREKGTAEPVRWFIPKFLRQYSQYGAIANQIKSGSKILDLGCGDGNVCQLFLAKGEVVGVDISQAALKKAASLGIKTKLHDLNKLPLPFSDGSFNCVILTDVLEHLLDPLSLLKDSYRILTKDGRLIVTAPNFARLGNRLRMLWGDPIDILHFEKYGDELEHLHWFTIGKLEHLLIKAGWKKIKFVPTGLPFGFIFGKLSFPGLAKMLTVVAER